MPARWLLDLQCLHTGCLSSFAMPAHWLFVIIRNAYTQADCRLQYFHG
jgi:hypothetical protein